MSFADKHIWDSIIDYGINIRNISYSPIAKFMPDLGKHSWEYLSKEITSNLVDSSFESDWEWTWNQDELNKLYDYVHDDLKMNGDNHDIKDNTWSQKHFILQLIRIPKNNKLSLIKLYQIAYNIGQYKESLAHEQNLSNVGLRVYTSDIINFFISNKLDDMNTYIKKSSCL